jgi:predicted ferric reductase
MREPIAWGVLAGALLLVLADALLARLGLVGGAPLGLDPAWTRASSRAFGFGAHLALALDVVLGLMVSPGWLDRILARKHAVELHRWLTIATLGLVGLHALALLAGRWADAFDLTLPFLSPHRRFAIGIGVLSFWGVLAVHATFAWRKRLGARVFRALHALSLVIFVLATLHALLAPGTSRSLPLALAYFAALAIVVGLSAARLVSSQVKKCEPSGVGGS